MLICHINFILFNSPITKLKQMPASSSTPSARVQFANRLKMLRVPRGFSTARSFAKALGIDENRYTRYERAEVEPDLSLIAKICGLLGVTPNDLLDFAIQSGQPTGFGEAGAPAPLPPVAEGTNGTGSPRHALAWQLAEELAKIDAPSAASAFERFARKSKLFAEIEADTFTFIGQMASDRRIAKLEAASACRIAELAEQLISAVNAEILRPSPPV